jgi:2-polyprenyl-6-methoxyphenol hydroxylase-like FAD-dependent oxidoreductase
MLPIGQGRIYWYAIANSRANGDDRRAGRKQTVLELFRGYRPPIATLIEATDEAMILRHDIYDRPPLQRWGADRVTLLGDAAHPPTPNQGQGACQAIEDALVLAYCLREADDVGMGAGINAALRAYEDLRSKRTADVIHQSRRAGWVLQWRHPLACALREVALRASTGTLISRQFQATLAYDPQ